MKTKVICVQKPNEIQIKEYDIYPKENEVLVKTHLASICGTDKNYYRGKMPPATNLKNITGIDSEAHNVYPLRMGHEGSGVVCAVGPGVTDLKVGDQVMSFGWYNTMSEYFVAPIRYNGYGVIGVPESMTLDEAALGEPAACAIYAGMQSGVELGDTVVVVGAGFAGQIISQVVKKMGAAKVIVVDIIKNKLTLASSLGADIVIDSSSENAVDIILENTHGFGADVVIEAAGTQQAIQLCTDVLKHGGILGLYSWVLEPVNLYINRWHNDGFDIRTLALMHRIKHDRLWWAKKALSNVSTGMIKISPLISHTYDLDDAVSAFNTACYDSTSCKVMIRP